MSVLSARELRDIRSSLDHCQRSGGYLLALACTLGAEYPALTWDWLRSELDGRHWSGGYPLSAVAANFNSGRKAR